MGGNERTKENRRKRQAVDHKSVNNERRCSYCAVLGAEITGKNTRTK